MEGVIEQFVDDERVLMRVTSCRNMEHIGRLIFTRKQKGKLLRRNILIAGLAWLGFTACRMLGESDEKLKKAEAKARNTEAELAMMHHNYDQHGEEENDSPTVPENDICCDGKASITKKPE